MGTVSLYGIHIVSLVIEGQERLCLAQISNTLLKQFSYNEIHNRRVALGITCVQCTPVQLEILRRAGAMPPSSRRCGMITRREAERLCKSFLSDNAPPRLISKNYSSNTYKREMINYKNVHVELNVTDFRKILHSRCITSALGVVGVHFYPRVTIVLERNA